MNIDALNVKLRRRGLWEAVDLGVLLAQQYFWPLWLTWLVGAVPTLVLLGGMALYQAPLWALFGVWLCKPLYENVMLNRLSKMIFGETAPLRPIVTTFISSNKGHWVYALTLSRLTLNRSFAAPVSLLERQKGKARRVRLSQLSMSMQSITQFSTLLLFLIEVGLTWAVILFLFSIFPSDFVDHDLNALLADKLFQQWGFTVVSFCVMSVIAPFYVCTGFALYLSRRTELEAWDIELNFKKLTARVTSKARKRYTNTRQHTAMVLAVVMCACGLISAPNQAMAAEKVAVQSDLTKQQTQHDIRAILAGDEFGRNKTEYRWERKKRFHNSPEEDNDMDMDLEAVFDAIASIVNGLAFALKCAVIALLLIAVGYVLSHSQAFLNGMSSFFTRSEDVDMPSHLFGLDMKQNSLPPNVSEQARAWVVEKKYREALALLLRASLIHVLHKQRVVIPSSATEQECLRLFKGHLPIRQYDFLEKLVNQWILVAYAHETPNEPMLLNLCDQWQQLYEGGASSALDRSHAVNV